MLDLTEKQLEKLSDLFMDLAKGLFLAAFAVQIFKETDLVSFSKYLVGGIISIYFSLSLIGRRKQ